MGRRKIQSKIASLRCRPRPSPPPVVACSKRASALVDVSQASSCHSPLPSSRAGAPPRIRRIGSGRARSRWSSAATAGGRGRSRAGGRAAWGSAEQFDEGGARPVRSMDQRRARGAEGRRGRRCGEPTSQHQHGTCRRSASRASFAGGPGRFPAMEGGRAASEGRGTRLSHPHGEPSQPSSCRVLQYCTYDMISDAERVTKR